MILRHCWQLLLCLLFTSVYAADETKIKLGNTTIERTVQLRTHSLFAPYIDQDLQNRWWDFGGDAYVNTNKHVRLTQNWKSQTGYLWSRLPLSSSNWVMEIEFKVSGDSSHLYGDGLAIWFTKDRAQMGPAFGNQNPFEGVGIFLDTYANTRHSYAFPRIMAVKGDGTTAYDVGTDGDSQSLGACSANFRQTNVHTKLKIVYVKDKFMDVQIQHKAWDEWTKCFNIPKLKLPASPFVGFTAATGDVSDAHDIISVSTHSAILSKEDSQRDSMKSFMGTGTGQGGGFLSFFVKLLVIGAIGGAVYYGWQVYKSREAYAGAGNFGGPAMQRFNSGANGMGGFGGGPGFGGYSGGGGAYGGSPAMYGGDKRAY